MKKTSFEEFAEQNRKLDEKLTNENYIIFTKMMAGLNPVRMGKVTSEVVRCDLLALSLSAQERNEPLQQALGEDAQSFSAAVQQAGGYAPKKEIFLEVCYQVLLLFVVCSSAAALLSACMLQLPTQLSYSVTLGIGFFTQVVLICILWGCYSLWVSPHLAARRSPVSWLRYVVMAAMWIGTGMFSEFIWGSRETVGISMPWGVFWLCCWGAFAVVSVYRRQYLNKQFIVLTEKTKLEKADAENS